MQGGDGVSLTVPPNMDPTRRAARLTLDKAPCVVLPGARNTMRDLSRVILSAEAVGMAQEATQMAAEYAKARLQFGRPIAMYQGVKHHCANMAVASELATSATWDAARASAEGGKQDVSAGKGDVLDHHDAVQRVDPAKSRLRPARNGNGAAVENQTGEDAENGKRPGSDLGLETSENGKAGDEFEQACNIGKRGCGGQAGAGDHAGRAGRIDQLGIAGDDEHGREKNAAGEIGCQHLTINGGIWLILKPNGQPNMAKGEGRFPDNDIVIIAMGGNPTGGPGGAASLHTLDTSIP